MDISVRLVDSTHGIPAAGVNVHLDLQVENVWQIGPPYETDRSGRIDAIGDGIVETGRPDRYRIVVDFGRYFARFGVASCHPEIVVVFARPEPAHQACLEVGASAYGYCTVWTHE
jgi:5-hydroxyisourate hydrolase-like protein (transthyretin family)